MVIFHSYVSLPLRYSRSPAGCRRLWTISLRWGCATWVAGSRTESRGCGGIPLRPSELVLPLYTKNEWKITIFKWKTYQISKHTKIIARISKHTKNYGKIHHFQWVNHGKSTISIGPFSIAMCNRGYTVSPILPNVRQFFDGDKSGF